MIAIVEYQLIHQMNIMDKDRNIPGYMADRNGPGFVLKKQELAGFQFILKKCKLPLVNRGIS